MIKDLKWSKYKTPRLYFISFNLQLLSFKKNSQAKAIRFLKFSAVKVSLEGAVKIIKNNLPRFQLMTKDPILHLCLCICV